MSKRGKQTGARDCTAPTIDEKLKAINDLACGVLNGTETENSVLVRWYNEAQRLERKNEVRWLNTAMEILARATKAVKSSWKGDSSSDLKTVVVRLEQAVVSTAADQMPQLSHLEQLKNDLNLSYLMRLLDGPPMGHLMETANWISEQCPSDLSRIARVVAEMDRSNRDEDSDWRSTIGLIQSKIMASSKGEVPSVGEPAPNVREFYENKDTKRGLLTIKHLYHLYRMEKDEPRRYCEKHKIDVNKDRELVKKLGRKGGGYAYKWDLVVNIEKEKGNKV